MSERQCTFHGHHRAMVVAEKDGVTRKYKTFRTISKYDDGSEDWDYSPFEGQWDSLKEGIDDLVSRGAFTYEQIRGIEI